MIDTHCHINDRESFPNPTEEIEFAQSMGVDRLIAIGTSPGDWDRAIALADQYPNVFAVIGWHPNYTADYNGVDHLRSLLEHPKVLALGEIGLDYHWDYSPREMQYRALNEQLDLAAELSLPVVFHAREAYSDLIDFLDKRPPHPYLFHCFAGNTEEGARASALGAYFGVDGPVSYKKSDELREVIRSLPVDRLVVETDSPYLSPMPYRGKPNRPGYVKHVGEALATTLGIPFEKVDAITTANAERFFGPKLVSR